jgi:hypothetical protein
MGMEEKGGIEKKNTDLLFLKMGNEVRVGGTYKEKVSRIVITLDEDSGMEHEQFMHFASKILTLIDEGKKEWKELEKLRESKKE